MIKYKQFETLSIETFQMPEQTLMVHGHDYFEFVFIQRGSGEHLFREEMVDFHQGDFFFIAPGEAHSFSVIDPVEASVVRFNSYIKSLLKIYISKWDMEGVVLSKALRSPLNARIRLNPADRQIAFKLLDTLREMGHHLAQNEDMILHQLVSLVVLIERNYVSQRKNKASKDQPVLLAERIIKHIHKNLKRPEVLTVAYLAELFNIPVSYLGLYFKRNTGSPLKSYIDECRMIMISRKIRNSDSSLSEIAFDFGFTDESHFLKRFKKHFGTSPSVYRESGKA